MTAWGKTPVVCTDSPGFIVNRVNRPFTLEALESSRDRRRLRPAIDPAIREAGFPMGPFELMDLIGVDINLAAARGLYERDGPSARGSGRRRSRSAWSRPAAWAARPAAASTDTTMPVASLGPDADARARTTLERPTSRSSSGSSWPSSTRRSPPWATGSRVRRTSISRLRLGAGHPVGPFERVAGSRRAASRRAPPSRAGSVAAGPRFEPAAILADLR